MISITGENMILYNMDIGKSVSISMGRTSTIKRTLSIILDDKVPWRIYYRACESLWDSTYDSIWSLSNLVNKPTNE